MEEPSPLEDQLLPLAARLSEASQALATFVGGELADEELRVREDTRKLCVAVEEFDRSLRNDVSGRRLDEDGEQLRSLRHELKNRLNHIVGPAQFVAMEWEGEQSPKALQQLLGLCQECLLVLNGDHAHENARGKVSVAEMTSLDQSPHPGRILVADDDPENRHLLARQLEAMGHEPIFVENGRQALERVRDDERLDAVLLDIRMPEMDGFEVLERLRAGGHLRHTPVIVVTGLQEERDAVRCIEIGAEDFLSRPIRPALLAARLNASLEKKRLREKVFEQHFTPELAREFARNPDLMKMKGRSAEVTVLFCDIRRFSGISERLGPEQTIDWLGAVMGEFSGLVIDQGGVLVDYTGDELLAMWGAPGEQPDHAERACEAALEMLSALPEINRRWSPVIEAETAIGIGISTGPALVGNIGTHRKFKYGPLGTTVNLGSRVQGATKYLDSTVLATGGTMRRVREDSTLRRRRLCRVKVQNIQEPVELWELAPADRPDWEELAERYQEAAEHFEAGSFNRASAVLGELLVRYPEDGPSLMLMSRVVEAMLGKRSEEKEFDSVWELPGK